MRVNDLSVEVYRIPTDRPEADGTITWDSTTMVLVVARADSGTTGLGFSYASSAAASIVGEVLAPAVSGYPVDDVGASWTAMVKAVRNVGRPGVASTAISAVDVALWDLKARALGQPLFKVLGGFRDDVPIYGSGGFTTYSEAELAEQLGGWASQGMRWVKMKIAKDWGTRQKEDLQRMRTALDAIGTETELFVDANGGYDVKQAVRLAARFEEMGVTYFEEPVSSDHLDELALVRQHSTLNVAAGEYGYDPYYFKAMLAAESVDIMQADATRCLGITGWLQAASLANAHGIPFSAHTSPSIHAHAASGVPQISHVEYFYDHARIEQMFFDGTLMPKNGVLCPDPTRPGLGLELKRQDTEKWRIS